MQPRNDDPTRHWTEPGIYLVAPGVYRIPLPLPNDGLRAVNVYAITDGSDLVLVDSGWALDEARDQLATALNAIGAGLGDIREFLITHIHRDHYTMAIALRREFGGAVALGQHEEASLKATADPDAAALAGQVRLLRTCGAESIVAELAHAFDGSSNDESGVWEHPDEWLVPGRREVLAGRELDVVHTPGHTTGHVVYVDDAEGLLFSGDHVLPHITPSIGFEAVPVDLPLGDYLRSLRRVRQMPDRRLLPAHGPVSDSAHRRVDELIEHHEKRLDTMLDTVRTGVDTAYQVAARFGWTRRQRALSEMDVFNQMLAVLETAAHLDLLATSGKLTASEVDGVRHYGPA